MSVWIGSLGGMVETPCLSGLQVSTDDRTIWSGGAGTLGPLQATTWGAGQRRWQASINVASPADQAALQTLAYRQHKYGVGGYRMLACDAHQTNILTPHASLDFTGWSGSFTVSTLYTASVQTVGGGTVLYPETPLEARTPLEGGPPPVQVESVAALTVVPETPATVLLSPIVPVRPGHSITVGAFAQGAALVSVQWVNAAGTVIGGGTLSSESTTGLQRRTPSTLAPANAAGLRLNLSGGTRYAWPSVTWTAGPRPFAIGRGAESVYLPNPDESVLMATRDAQHSAWSYTIREVAA